MSPDPAPPTAPDNGPDTGSEGGDASTSPEVTSGGPVPPAASGRRSFSRGGRFGSRLNLCAIVFLSFYIVVVADLIIYFHPMRNDLTVDRVHTLSEGSLKRLGLIEEPVRVVIPILFQEGNPVNRIQAEVFARARSLLDEYVARQPLIKIAYELNLRAHADSLTWERLQTDYKLAPNQINRFIFVLGEGKELRRQSVGLDELAVYDRPTSQYESHPAKIHKFRGEEAFTHALTRLVRREDKKLYFVDDLGAPELTEEGQSGLSQLNEELEASGYGVHSLSLQREPLIPGDCDLLVCIGPTEALDAKTRAKIQEYLLQDGRMLLALGPR